MFFFVVVLLPDEARLSFLRCTLARHHAVLSLLDRRTRTHANPIPPCLFLRSPLVCPVTSSTKTLLVFVPLRRAHDNGDDSRRASPSGSPNARQQQQHLQQQRPPGHKRLRSLSELKQHQLLALSVRKISGADNDCDAAAAAALSNGGATAASPKSASSGSGEVFPTEMSISTGSSSDFEDSSGFGSGDAETGVGGGGGGGGRARGSHPGQGLRTRGKWKRSDGVAGGRVYMRVVTKNRPLRNIMRLLPNGRKSGTSRAG